MRVTPDILEQQKVQLKVEPSIFGVRNIERFGGEEEFVSLVHQNRSETNSIVVVDSGQTVIIGGLRISNVSKSDTGPELGPWGGVFERFFTNTQDNVGQTEFWVLINVSIREAGPIDALINESVAFK